MVLKIKIAILILFLSNRVFAETNREIFYTDKYDANYFSSTNLTNTQLYIGSDLFKFIDIESLHICEAFIDSFINSQNINLNSKINIENGNRFRLDIGILNAEDCYNLSKVWTENYKIEFQNLLFDFVKTLNPDSRTLNADKIIFKKLIKDELTRFYNPGNNVNNTNIAFVIPKALSDNKFKKVFTHYNTKRYSSKETQLNTTEILYSEDLDSKQIRYNYPSVNRQSFLKNCLSLNIIESLFKESILFRTDYNINQCITSFTILTSQDNFTDFSVIFDTLVLDNNALNRLVNESYTNILSKCSQSLFYYSFYDIEKLKVLKETYNLSYLNMEIKSLNERKNYVLEISKENNFYFKNNKILAFNLLDFTNDIESKVNSTDFVNEADSIIINKLKLFMMINKNYNLNIVGHAKRTEYLFIEKAKKDSLLTKYIEMGYRISQRKDLSLYRSLLIFSELTESGIKHNRMKCAGSKSKTPGISLNLYIND